MINPLTSRAVRLVSLSVMLAAVGGCKPPANSGAGGKISTESEALTPAAQREQDILAKRARSRAADSDDVKKVFELGLPDPRSLDPNRQPMTNEMLTHMDFLFPTYKIDDNNIAIIEKFPNLESLSLTTEKLTDASMPLIGKKKSLRHLELKAMPITDAGIAHLKDLTELKHLDLSATPITDEGLVILDNMPKLEQLHLELCRGVTDRSVDRFKSMKTLTWLGLERSGVSPDREAELKAALPNCKVFVQ